MWAGSSMTYLSSSDSGSAHIFFTNFSATSLLQHTFAGGLGPILEYMALMPTHARAVGIQCGAVDQLKSCLVPPYYAFDCWVRAWHPCACRIFDRW